MSLNFSSSTRVWLVRHGQTDWNKEGRYQGQSDIPLNEAGLLQATQTAKRLSTEKGLFDAIYSSDLLRARQTAEVIACFFHLPVVTDARLREIRLGLWEGQLHAAVRGENIFRPGVPIDPSIPYAPDGESVLAVAERAKECMDWIAKQHSAGQVIVVTHGVVIAALLSLVRGVPLGEFRSQAVENAQATRILWHPNNPPDRKIPV